MAVRPLYAKYYNVYFADTGTAGSSGVVIMSDCILEKISMVNWGAVTTAANVFTYKINGGGAVAVGNQPVQAAGLATNFTPTAVQLSAGDVLELISDGAGSGTSPTIATVQVRELTR